MPSNYHDSICSICGKPMRQLTGMPSSHLSCRQGIKRPKDDISVSPRGTVIMQFESNSLDAYTIEKLVNIVLNHQREFGFDNQFDNITWYTTEFRTHHDV